MTSRREGEKGGGEMTTEIERKSTHPGWKPYHLDIQQFRTMIEAGVFPDGARLELLGGILVAKGFRTAPHDYLVGAIGEEIRRVTPDGWLVREEKPITIGKRSCPEPDLAVVRGPRSHYAARTPTQKETALVVEVAESSYATDRGDRWRIYATARIPVYWIARLPERQVEVYRDPIGRGPTATYQVIETFGPEADVPVIIDGREVGRFTVKDLFP